MDAAIKMIRGLTLQNGQWVINKQVAGNTIYKRTGTADYAEACAILEIEVRTLKRLALREDWKRQVEEWSIDSSSWMNRTFRKMRIRGKHNGKGCSIKFAQLKLLVLKSNGCCQVTGIPFSEHRKPGARVAPFMPSVDRIDSRLGYHDGNCRIVCVAVNMAMLDWGMDVLVRIAQATLLRYLQNAVDGENTADFETMSCSSLAKKETAKEAV